MKNLPVNAGDVRGVDSILDGEDSPGEGHGNPLQYSCLENPMDRAAWRETVHRVAGRVRRNSSDLAAAAAVTLHIKCIFYLLYKSICIIAICIYLLYAYIKYIYN